MEGKQDSSYQCGAGYSITHYNQATQTTPPHYESETTPLCPQPQGIPLYYQLQATPLYYQPQATPLFYQPQTAALYSVGHHPTYGSTAVVHQPMPSHSAVPTDDVPDHMCLAILACIFCFWPVALFGIFKANEARFALARGDVQSAKTCAEASQRYSVISILIGVLLTLITTVVTVVVIAVN